MKCDDELLSAYADGELAGGEKAEIERHLAECERCRRTVESLMALQSAVADTLVETIEPMDMADSVMMLLPASKKHSALRPVWALAAATCLVIALVVGLHRQPVESRRSVPAVVRSVDTTPIPVLANKPKIVLLPKAQSKVSRTAHVWHPVHRRVVARMVKPVSPKALVPSRVVQESPAGGHLANGLVVENGRDGKYVAVNDYGPDGERRQVRLYQLLGEPPMERERRIARAVVDHVVDGDRMEANE